MPCCAVVVCRNRSENVKYNPHGVSYHIFPSDPVIKSKWIEVCHRGPKWVPTRTSTICSMHFEEMYFQPLKIRRLFDWAVPTLRITHTDKTVPPPLPPPTSDILSIPGLEPDDTLDFEKVENANNSEEFIQEINGNEPLPLLCLSPTLDNMVPLDLEAEISKVKLENKELQTQLKRFQFMVRKQKRQNTLYKQRTSRYRKRIEFLEKQLKEIKGQDKVASENVASENIATENVASENFVSEIFTSENVTSENFTSEKFVSGSFPSDNFISENVASDNFISENVASDNFISENVTSENVIEVPEQQQTETTIEFVYM